MGYGGPHAAYMAVRDALKRSLPGRHRRRVDRFARATRLSAGAADPRAAYSPRKGDLQHLHRAGAAGGHRLDVCGLSRAGGAGRTLRATCIAAPPCWRRGCASSALRRGRKRSSTRSRWTPAQGKATSSPAPWPRKSTCGSADGTLGIALDETTTAAVVEAVWRAFGGNWLTPISRPARAMRCLPS